MYANANIYRYTEGFKCKDMTVCAHLHKEN